jgi:hypothetical protein
MMRILLVGILLVTLILSGCSAITGGSNSMIVPPPVDEFRYETSRTVVIKDTGETITIPTDFTLLESPVRIGNFCAGCRGDYYLKFWYVPLQTDYYLGETLTGNNTTDNAVLSKGLYKNDSIGVSYLDNVYSIDFRDKDKSKITIEATPVAQSYNPDTRELIISGFPQESQNYFSVTYYHNQPGRFNVYYVPSDPETPTIPGFDLTSGFSYVAEAQSWVGLPEIQTVPPFMVRCAPVSIIIPKDAVVPSKFEFCIGVAEIVSGAGSGVVIPRGFQERWLVSCREVS